MDYDPVCASSCAGAVVAFALTQSVVSPACRHRCDDMPVTNEQTELFARTLEARLDLIRSCGGAAVVESQMNKLSWAQLCLHHAIVVS